MHRVEVTLSWLAVVGAAVLSGCPNYAAEDRVYAPEKRTLAAITPEQAIGAILARVPRWKDIEYKIDESSFVCANVANGVTYSTLWRDTDPRLCDFRGSLLVCFHGADVSGGSLFVKSREDGEIIVEAIQALKDNALKRR